MQANAPSARQATAGVGTPPLVLIESAEIAAQAHLRRALDAARAGGWQPVGSWLVPRGRVVCHGVVATHADAVLALRAAVGGAGVVVVGRASRDTLDRLVDDLRRIGPVEHVTDDGPPPPAVDDAQRRLLLLLSEGWTLGEAATELGLARRTADRRLEAARRALGAERTADALAMARRLGWFDPIGASD